MARDRKPAPSRQGKQKRPALQLIPGGQSRKAPAPPEKLLKRTQQRWRDFWGSDIAQVVDEADLHRLHRWIKYVDEWERSYSAYRRSPMVKGSQGQPVINPLARRLTELEGAIEKTEREFGMTPRSRLNLGIGIGQAAMTAAKLNQMLKEDDGDSDQGETAAVIEGVAFEEA